MLKAVPERAAGKSRPVFTAAPWTSPLPPWTVRMCSAALVLLLGTAGAAWGQGQVAIGDTIVLSGKAGWLDQNGNPLTLQSQGPGGEPIGEIVGRTLLGDGTPDPSDTRYEGIRQVWVSLFDQLGSATFPAASYTGTFTLAPDRLSLAYTVPVQKAPSENLYYRIWLGFYMGQNTYLDLYSFGDWRWNAIQTGGLDNRLVVSPTATDMSGVDLLDKVALVRVFFRLEYVDPTDPTTLLPVNGQTYGTGDTSVWLGWGTGAADPMADVPYPATFTQEQKSATIILETFGSATWMYFYALGADLRYNPPRDRLTCYWRADSGARSSYAVVRGGDRYELHSGGYQRPSWNNKNANTKWLRYRLPVGLRHLADGTLDANSITPSGGRGAQTIQNLIGTGEGGVIALGTVGTMRIRTVCIPVTYVPPPPQPQVADVSCTVGEFDVLGAENQEVRSSLWLPKGWKEKNGPIDSTVTDTKDLLFGSEIFEQNPHAPAWRQSMQAWAWLDRPPTSTGWARSGTCFAHTNALRGTRLFGSEPDDAATLVQKPSKARMLGYPYWNGFDTWPATGFGSQGPLALQDCYDFREVRGWQSASAPSGAPGLAAGWQDIPAFRPFIIDPAVVEANVVLWDRNVLLDPTKTAGPTLLDALAYEADDPPTGFSFTRWTWCFAAAHGAERASYKDGSGTTVWDSDQQDATYLYSYQEAIPPIDPATERPQIDRDLGRQAAPFALPLLGLNMINPVTGKPRPYRVRVDTASFLVRYGSATTPATYYNQRWSVKLRQPDAAGQAAIGIDPVLVHPGETVRVPDIELGVGRVRLRVVEKSGKRFYRPHIWRKKWTTGPAIFGDPNPADDTDNFPSQLAGPSFRMLYAWGTPYAQADAASEGMVNLMLPAGGPYKLFVEYKLVDADGNYVGQTPIPPVTIPFVPVGGVVDVTPDLNVVASAPLCSSVGTVTVQGSAHATPIDLPEARIVDVRYSLNGGPSTSLDALLHRTDATATSASDWGYAPEFSFGVQTVSCSQNQLVVEAQTQQGDIAFTQIFTIQDDGNPPLVVATQDVVVLVDTDGNGEETADLSPYLTATDDCGPAVVSVPRGPWPVNVTAEVPVVATAHDLCGNAATATILVRVLPKGCDGQPPVLTGPLAFVEVTDQDRTGAEPLPVGWTPASATDARSGQAVAVGYAYAGGPAIPDPLAEQFPVGASTVVASATDACGNTTSHTFVVSVLPGCDLNPPTILPLWNVALLDCDDDGGEALGAFFAGATATDTEDAAETPPIPVDVIYFWSTPSQSAAGDLATLRAYPFPRGTTKVWVIATDSCDNKTSASFSVLVSAPPPLTLACPPAVVQAADPGQCAATVAITAPAASDLCDPAVSVIGVRDDGLALSAPYPLGTTVIDWTATNRYARTKACAQSVTVEDREPPTVIASLEPIVEPEPDDHEDAGDDHKDAGDDHKDSGDDHAGDDHGSDDHAGDDQGDDDHGDASAGGDHGDDHGDDDHGDDHGDDDHSESRSFVVHYAVTDRCDPLAHVVSAYLELPDVKGCEVVFKRRGPDDDDDDGDDGDHDDHHDDAAEHADDDAPPVDEATIEIETKRDGSCRVTVTGRNPEALWASLVQQEGVPIGVPVADGLVLSAPPGDGDRSDHRKKDEREERVLFSFTGGVLTGVGAPSAMLICVGRDAAGNAAIATASQVLRTRAAEEPEKDRTGDHGE